MAISTIQTRRGEFADFDAQKMLPGEPAAVLAGDPSVPSGKAFYVAFAAGDVRRLVSIEDLEMMLAAGQFKGEKGDKGESVKSADINDEGHLMLTLTDGTEIDAGLVDDALTKIEEAKQAAKDAAESSETAGAFAASASDSADKAKASADSSAKSATASAASADAAAASAEKAADAVTRENVVAALGYEPADAKTAAKRPNQYTYTLLSASWQGTAFPYTYTINIPGLSAAQDVFVSAQMQLTEDQIDAFSDACITGNDQKAGQIILQAVHKPLIDLPIVIEVKDEPVSGGTLAASDPPSIEGPSMDEGAELPGMEDSAYPAYGFEPEMMEEQAQDTEHVEQDSFVRSENTGQYSADMHSFGTEVTSKEGDEDA